MKVRNKKDLVKDVLCALLKWDAYDRNYKINFIGKISIIYFNKCVRFNTYG